MKDRIRQLRKKLDMTQTAFGERLKVKGNTVTSWETGNRVPLDSAINSICREYNVEEVWLRTGEGEMFRQVSRDEEITAFMGKIAKSGDEDFRRRLVSVLCRLDTAEWELLEKMALKLAAEYGKEDQA